ncbi:MAG: hypothetical protein GF344_02000 [Chitinivibrionales bacterium]|nr:hypothetical protein [Chitinivibrionales bacterium]MBD3355868.1 hypothetical protein [Chitinivibrionales bacterium]
MNRAVMVAVLVGALTLTSCNRVLDSDPYSPAPPPPQTIPPDPEVQLNYYFGNLHSHTGYSDGIGTPDEAFDWARYMAGYDFYAITDHGELLTSSQWRSIGRSADAKNVDGQFVALRGFEWTHPRYGHINVLNTASFTSVVLTYDPDDFYAWIDKNDGLAQFNHPGRESASFQNFAYLDNAYDNFFAIETGNGSRGNNNGLYTPFFGAALEKGWRLAPTNNQDNHTLSTNSHRTVIIASALTRDDLIEAMRERRLYSSDDPNTRLSFKSGNFRMGSNIVGAPGMYTFNVVVDDDEPITKIELLNRAGTILDTHVPPSGQTDVSTVFSIEVEENDCFYVKVYQDDTNNDDTEYSRQITIGAPIWIYPG